MSFTLRSTAVVVSGLAIMLGTAGAAFACTTPTPASGRTTVTSSSSGKPSAVCITKTPNGIAVKACNPATPGNAQPTKPLSTGKSHA